MLSLFRRILAPFTNTLLHAQTGDFLGTSSNGVSNGASVLDSISFSAAEIVASVSVDTASSKNASVVIDLAKAVDPKVARFA